MYYFAYGSNMLHERLRRRVGDIARPKPAVISGRLLLFNKRGRDGSGKCNLTIDAGSRVRGAVYKITRSQADELSRFEFGYRRELISVESDGRRLEALSYIAEREFVDHSLRPFCWYRDLVIRAASDLEFPEEYIARLARTPFIEDPDDSRRQRHATLVAAAGDSEAWTGS